jgi:hypothetical protein
MKHFAILLALAGCTRADPESSPSRPGVAFAEPPPTTTTTPPPARPAADVKVALTGVTLDDDCRNYAAPAPREEEAKSADRDSSSMDRPCSQSSMQLVISTPAPSRIQIKSVELFDEAGVSLGMLAASSPTRWSDTRSQYDAWDESLAASSSATVSYKLQQPNWSKVGNRNNQMYTLKAVVSVGGSDRSLKKDFTLTTRTALPPDVET